MPTNNEAPTLIEQGSSNWTPLIEHLTTLLHCDASYILQNVKLLIKQRDEAAQIFAARADLARPLAVKAGELISRAEALAICERLAKQNYDASIKALKRDDLGGYDVFDSCKREAEAIGSLIAALPAQPAAVQPAKCRLCGHDQIGLDSTCEFYVAEVDEVCGCKCEFPPVQPTTSDAAAVYHCSCGAACTAEEYIDHYFIKGHDKPASDAEALRSAMIEKVRNFDEWWDGAELRKIDQRALDAIISALEKVEVK